MGLVKFKQTQRRPFFANLRRTDPLTDPATLLPSNTLFAVSTSTGTTIGTLVDPYAGMGLGATTYATYGTVPAQLALSGANVNATSTPGVANTVYPISVLATSGDGTRKVGETVSFLSVAG